MTGKDIKNLFVRHRRELFGYIQKKLRNQDLAAELTQETFLRLAEQQRDNPALVITHSRSYLYRTAHNLIIDHVRQQQRNKTEPVPVDELVEVIDESPTPEQIASGKRELAVARAALLELPERTRQIFVLVRLERLTYSEVAQRLAISESSVQKHLAKAIKHVLQSLRY